MVVFFSLAVKNTVSSPGWFFRQKGEEETRMRAISFQAEEGRDQAYQEERAEEKVEEHLKKVQTSPPDTEFANGEKKDVIALKTSLLPAEKSEWRFSATATLKGKRIEEGDEPKEVDMEKAENQLKESKTEVIITSKLTQQEDTEAMLEVPSTKHGSVSASSEKSAMNSSRDGSSTTGVNATRNSSFGVDFDNTSYHGSTENVSTIPLIELCPQSGNISCSATNRGAGHGATSTAISAESFFPDHARAASGTSRSGSVWDSKVDGILPANRSETFTGENSVNGEGPDRNDEKLHSLKVRGLESNQSAHLVLSRESFPVDDLLAGSDFDSGIQEGEVLHLSHFNSAKKRKTEVLG